MRLILVGCEYVGKTTLANEIVEWTKRTMGGGRPFHDHFAIPSPEMTPESQECFISVTPQIKEMFQRFVMSHHLWPEFYRAPDHNMVGFHIEEAVYAPLYYGYGCKNSGAPMRSPEGERTRLAKRVEKDILEQAPDSVLVLLRASPDVIAKRMNENPHPRGLVQQKDIEYVLHRFEEEYEWSLMRRKFALDTTSATVEETLAQFVDQIEPLLSPADRLRILTHQSLQHGG